MLQRAHMLAICGSERPGGNTDQVLDLVTDIAQRRSATVEIRHLRDEHIRSGCGPCGNCNVRTLRCAIDDDVPDVVDAMSRADAIMYATPVHGFGTSSLMQSFIERAGVGYLRFNRPLANKVAGIVVTGRRYGFESVHTQLLENAMLNRMIVVGSGFPALVHGGRPGAALSDQEGLESVDRLVRRMIDMVDLLHRDRIAGGGLPLDDDNERQARPGSVGAQPLSSEEPL